jgi:hypothetical protein
MAVKRTASCAAFTECCFVQRRTVEAEQTRNARQIGSSEAPLLFESAKIQRFLAYLAHRSPARLHEVLSAIGTKHVPKKDRVPGRGV